MIVMRKLWLNDYKLWDKRSIRTVLLRPYIPSVWTNPLVERQQACVRGKYGWFLPYRNPVWFHWQSNGSYQPVPTAYISDSDKRADRMYKYFSVHTIPEMSGSVLLLRIRRWKIALITWRNWMLRYGSSVASLCWKTWEHLTCLILIGLSLAVNLVIEPERWKGLDFEY